MIALNGPYHTRLCVALVMLLLAGLSTTACDDTFIDPFDNDAQYYTVYGYLDQLSLNHTLRVIPITRTPERITTPDDADMEIDAIVTTEDLRTGEVVRWDHRLDQLADGSYAHIFRARFMVKAGRTYRLTVTRSDGQTTTAETTVPFLSAVVPTPDTLFYPYEIRPDDGPPRSIFLPGVVSPWNAFVTYDLQGTFVRLPYGRPGTPTEGGWRFDIDMGADAPRLRTTLGLDSTAALPLLHAIDLTVRLLDANWTPPDGAFDPEVLAQPGTLSNVENGLGFFGSMGLYQYTWIAPPQ